MHGPGGELLKTLGVKGRPAEGYVGRPFNMPTAVAIAPDGEIFASDGYGAHRVHRFSHDGELIKSWGKEGDGPGEFVNLHSVGVDSRGRVYICDRENDRVQLFDREGAFLEQWNDVTRPSDVYMVGDLVYVLDRVEEASRVTVYSLDGDIVARMAQHEFGSQAHLKTGHGICVDHDGSIYVAEVIGPKQVTKLQRV